MQVKLAKVIQKILIILITCMLTMGDVIAIGENLVVMPIFEEQSGEIQIEEPEILGLNQILITSKEYQMDGATKKILQLSLEINANELQTSTLKESQITLTTPIEGATPEEIYITKTESVNFVDASWEYVDGKLIINLVNDEIEKIKQQKVDRLVLTYVYAEDTDVRKISTKAVAEGKLYNGRKAVSEEIIYEVENADTFGEIIQVNSKMQEIYKTELQNENQEFFEINQINLNYKNIKMLNKIILSDGEIKGYSEEKEKQTNTKYKQTLINKQELLGVIGSQGTLVIKSEEQELSKIDKNTEADESGNIIINYEEEISKIIMEIVLDEQAAPIGQVENSGFSIIHKREIEKNDIKLDKQTKTIDVSLENDESKIKFQLKSIGEIKNKTTKAELGLNKQALTATQENELVATITLHTENKKYDLNKNPRYEMVLPKEIEKVELGEVRILNNKNFKIKENQIVENDNGQKVLVLILEGEQTEYAEEAGNVQIIVPFKLRTTKLIPTIATNIELYYTNEIAESYELVEDFGKEVKEISIIADTDLIVSTEAKIEETRVMSYKTDVATLEVEKTENTQIVEIKGTIINNTEEAKENIKIVGENELLNSIALTNGNVYYSETIEGPWADTFLEGQKYFKIEIEKLEIGEKIEFTYNMQIPENLEETKKYEAIYKVYQTEKLEKESKVIARIIKKDAKKGVLVNYSCDIEKYGGEILENAEIGAEMLHKINMINNTEMIQNVLVTVKIPECINKNNIDAFLYKKTEEIHPEAGEIIYTYLEKVVPQEDDNIATYSIQVPANTEIIVSLEFLVEKYIDNEIKTELKVFVDETEYEFINTKKVLSPASVEANMSAYVGEKEIRTNEEITLEKGDTIKYVTTIGNNGEASEVIEIVNKNNENFKRIKQQVYKNETLILEYGESNANIFGTEAIEIKENDVIKIVLILELINEIEEDTVIENYAEINGNYKNLQSNKINIKLLKKVVEEPSKPENPDDMQKPIKPDESVKESNTISGIAWLDKNKNGKQDELEDYLKGIKVTILNAITNEEITSTITDIDGEYQFKNLENGKYVLVFGYNLETYNLTTYKKVGIEESNNSDAILITQDGENIVKTEVIEISDNDVLNTDIGLVLKEKFDLEVSKKIKKATVKNEEGQTIYEYQNTDFAKIEIPSKYFKGTNIVIEYEIQIVNKGDISGYVKTLTDHKPEGLKFASELNDSWYEGTDGKLYCIEFGEDEIKPGETREVSLVLTKEITDTQIQYITNEVELEEVFNEYLVDDKNLDNNKAEAMFIVAIKTGVISSYIGLWLVCTTIIGTGIYFIRKMIIVKR